MLYNAIKRRGSSSVLIFALISRTYLLRLPYMVPALNENKIASLCTGHALGSARCLAEFCDFWLDFLESLRWFKYNYYCFCFTQAVFFRQASSRHLVAFRRNSYPECVFCFIVTVSWAPQWLLSCSLPFFLSVCSVLAIMFMWICYLQNMWSDYLLWDIYDYLCTALCFSLITYLFSSSCCIDEPHRLRTTLLSLFLQLSFYSYIYLTCKWFKVQQAPWCAVALYPTYTALFQTRSSWPIRTRHHKTSTTYSTNYTMLNARVECWYRNYSVPGFRYFKGFSGEQLETKRLQRPL